MIIDIPGIATTLQSIMKLDNPYGEVLFLQAPKSNTSDVNFGPIGECELFLEPGLSASYPITSIASIQVCAEAGQKLIVIINRS